MCLNIILLFYIGEFIPIDDVIRMQRDNHEIIYGRREVFSTYKWEAIQQRTPKVLILGSSRVMAFRSQFFHLNEDAIYNGGMELTNIRRVKWMLDELAQQSKLPEIIILGLDQDWFLPERASSTKIGRIQISAPMSQPPDLPTILNRVRAVIANIIENRYAIADILDRRDPFYQAYTIGFNGIVSSNGFRWDGSRIVNPLRLHTLSDEQRFSNVYRLISANAERFRRSSAYDMEALDVLQDIIKFCNEHNIALITFSPPYAPSVYQQLIADGGYNYIPRLTNRLDEIMNEAKRFLF